MGKVGIAYFLKSQEEIINEIKELCENIKNKEIVNLYNYYLSNIEDNIYTIQENKNILVTLHYSLKKIEENIYKNLNIRKDVLFREEEEEISLLEELMNGLIIAVKNEHEENKLKYYGYLLGNIIFEETLDRDECNRLIRICKSLSYCQIKLINMYVISQTIQIPILKREDYSKTGISNYKLLGLLQDTLEMIQKSILNGSGKIVLDVAQINPSKIKVQGIGYLLYNLMSLNNMPYDELEDILEILSSKN